MIVVGFLIGVGIYGFIVMFGVMVMELVLDKIVGIVYVILSMFFNCKFFLVVKFICICLLLGWVIFFLKFGLLLNKMVFI